MALDDWWCDEVVRWGRRGGCQGFCAGDALAKLISWELALSSQLAET